MAFEESNNSTAEAETQITNEEVINEQEQVSDEVIQEDQWATMSDEEFAELDLENESPVALEQEDEQDGENSSQEEEDADENEEEINEDLDQEEQVEEDSDDLEESEDDNEEKEDSEDNTQIYKEAYEKIFAPFKANGHEIKVDSPEDVIRLMQMGANYNSKMAALKPGLKTLKLLEKNKLLGDDKLGLLVDASKGNPEAIKQLMKDNQIDPMNIDLDEKSDYKPQLEKISDSEYELSEVMGRLKDNPYYEKTLQVVTKEWDESSKQTVVNQPALLETINQHIETGMYDIVQAEMVKQRALGHLNGVSDIVAYKQIGDSLNEQGAFDQLGSEGRTPTSNKKQQPVASKPRTPKKQSAENAKKRKAASPTKKTVSTRQPSADFNPLDMSDEEFEKQFDPRLM